MGYMSGLWLVQSITFPAQRSGTADTITHDRMAVQLRLLLAPAWRVTLSAGYGFEA
jgi:hypothetical protein